MAMIDVAEAKNARRAGIGRTDTMVSANGITPWHKNEVDENGRAVQNASGDRAMVVEGHAYTAEAFLKLAGLDWTVSLADLALTDGTAVPSHKAVLRSTDQRQLAVVKASYRPIQNVQAFETMDTFVREGFGTWETAGSLWDGRVVYVSLRVNDSFEVLPGDRVESYFVLSNAHDGSGAAKGFRTDHRPVCNNTLRAGRREGKNIWSVRHIGDVKKALDVAQQDYLALCEASKRTRELYRKMADTRIEASAEMRAFIRDCLAPEKLTTEKSAEADEIFGMLPGLDMAKVTSETARQAAARERQIDAIMNLAQVGKGTEIPGVKGSLWGLYNAVTEYASNEYPTRGTPRDQSLMVGAAGELLDRAILVAERRVS